MKFHCRLLLAVACLSLCTGASFHPGDPMVTAIEAQVGALMDPEAQAIRGVRIALPERALPQRRKGPLTSKVMPRPSLRVPRCELK